MQIVRWTKENCSGIEIITFDDEDYVHSIDGKPACVDDDGAKWWLSHGWITRTNGPAVIWKNGKVIWSINGQFLNSAKQFQKLSGNSDEQMAALIMEWGQIK